MIGFIADSYGDVVVCFAMLTRNYNTDHTQFPVRKINKISVFISRHY